MADVERLEEELSNLYKRFDDLCDELSRLAAKGVSEWEMRAEQFEQQVQQEVFRSSRYNHFFTLAMFPVDAAIAGHGLKELRRQLRASDVVTMIGIPKQNQADTAAAEQAAPIPRQRLAVLMPETNTQGAQIAIDRIKNKLHNIVKDVSYAVYPDDATDAKILLQMAASA